MELILLESKEIMSIIESKKEWMSMTALLQDKQYLYSKNHSLGDKMLTAGMTVAATCWKKLELVPTSSLYPMCMPQSIIIFLPPIVKRMQLRPTSTVQI